jgi:hypothetical protein
MRKLGYAALFAVACVVQTTPPAGTRLFCGAEGACPPGLVCNRALNLCESPGASRALPLFAGTRLTPFRPAPGDVLEAWPVALRAADGGVTLTFRFLDADGGVLQEGVAPRWRLPSMPGTRVRAEITATLAGGTETKSHASCERTSRRPEPGFVADRPQRVAAPGPEEPLPRVALDPAQHRLVLVGDGLWEFDLERARTVAGVAAPARESSRWRTLAPSGTAPGLPLLALDGTGERVLAFVQASGGSGSHAALSLDRGCEAWRSLASLGAPLPRNTSLTSDPLRARVLAFGGDGENGASGALIVFSRRAGEDVRDEPAIAGTDRPAARTDHVAVLDDSEADSLLVMGGTSCPTRGCAGREALADVWALALGGSSLTWRAVEGGTGPAAPIIRAAAAFDGPRRRVLVWGGCADTGCGEYRAALWSLSRAPGASGWSAVETRGESPPAGPAVAFYDAFDDALVVVAQPARGSPRVFSLALGRTPPEWTDLDPHPGSRSAHGAAMNDDSFIIYGGFANGAANDPDVWRWDGARWAKSVASGSPEPRAFMGFGGQASGDVFMHGGDSADGSRLGDLWRLRFEGAEAVWTRLDLGGAAPARAGHRPAFLPAMVPGSNPVLRFFGGNGLEDPVLSDGWDLVSTSGTLSWAAHTGALPTARRLHATVYDPGSHRVVLIGGEDRDGNPLGDVWTSPPAGVVSWQREILSPSFPPRAWHAAASLGADRIVVYGGTGNSGSLLLLCHDAARTPRWRWSDITPRGITLCGGESPSVVYDAPRDAVLFYGGSSDEQCTSVVRFAPASTLVCPP